MPDKDGINHNIELTAEEKRLCNASISEVILHYITRNPFYFVFVMGVFGGICILRYIYR